MDDGRYPHKDGDYTGFIMLVVNRLVEVTQDSQEDSSGRTVFEKFTEFNEQMFWLTNQKEFNNKLNDPREENSIKKEIEKHFSQILSNEGREKENTSRK